MSNFKQSDNLHILTKLQTVYLLDKVKTACFPRMFLKDKFVGLLICQSEIGEHFLTEMKVFEEKIKGQKKYL